MKRIMIASAMLIALAASAAGQDSQKKSKKDKTPSEEKAPPAVTADPNSLDFGDQVARRPSRAQRITITNSGGKKLYINSTTTQGDDWKDFRVVTDTCTGATIAAGKSCVIDVSLIPSATGRRQATLVLTDNAGDSPQSVRMIGYGINSADVPPGAIDH